MSAVVVPLRRKREQLDELSDEAVARACGGGDPVAVGLLFDRFHPRVARYLARMVSPQEVEDLVQATFLQVARGKTHYDGRASVITWLLAIATNVTRHHRRTMGRKRKLSLALAWSRPASESADVAKHVDSRRKLAKAKAALEALSPALREAFVLCELEGLSAREAAEVLRTSEAAVWKRVSKARKAIRKHVEGARR